MACWSCPKSEVNPTSHQLAWRVEASHSRRALPATKLPQESQVPPLVYCCWPRTASWVGKLALSPAWLLA